MFSLTDKIRSWTVLTEKKEKMKYDEMKTRKIPETTDLQAQSLQSIWQIIRYIFAT